MKKQIWSFVAAIFVLAVFMVTTNVQAMDEEALKKHIQLSGLIEVGAAWQDVEYADGTSEDASDLALTTVELAAEAQVNDWVSVAALLLYEDATSFEGENEESSVDLDAATVTIGNTEQYPLYLTAGKMYVPFGALLTHFPDDPLIDQPLTLLLGEIAEKAVLVGAEHQGFSVSGYLFNGDVDEEGEENNVGSYGFDANYSYDDNQGFDLLVGASYISNIADSDGLEEAVEGDELTECVAGFDAYVHVGYADFFLDAEYMAATDEFQPTELATGDGVGAEPSVWNLEVGYNLDWGKNLEIVLKYAGSDESEALGFPEDRYGLCLNQEVFEDVIVSLAYLNDDFEGDDLDCRKVIYGQIAVEF